MKKLLIGILLIGMLIPGCAYYSETTIKLSANKLKAIIPAGSIPIPAEGEKPEAWLIRKMSFSLWKETNENKTR